MCDKLLPGVMTPRHYQIFFEELIVGDDLSPEFALKSELYMLIRF